MSRNLEVFLRYAGYIRFELLLCHHVVLLKGHLHSLLHALCGSLKVGAYGESTTWGWHLENEVWAMWDSHDLGKPRTPDDGVVDVVEGRDFKSQRLDAKVLCRAKSDRQIDVSERVFAYARNNPEERGIRFLEFAERDPHLLQSPGEHHVDAGPSVDQNLLESGVADYGGYQQRILARLIEVEPLIRPTERDRLVGPIVWLRRL